MTTNGAVVRFHFSLEVDGEEIASSKGSDPVEVELGAHSVVPGLEAGLGEMAPGDKRVIVVPPEQGYGPVDPEGVQPLPAAAFAGQVTTLEVDQMVEGELNDTPFVARVAELRPDEVVLDFNHPLAGKTLRYIVDLVEIDPPA